MNLHELQHFLVLAEQLHFGKASQLCNLSASALTRSIQRLENSVGQELFERNNRSVTLTSAGITFQQYAKKTIRDWQRLQGELQLPDTVGGLVSIYASVTAVYSLLPELLEAYRTQYPDVHLELRTGSAEQSLQQVISGDIDLSVAALPDHPLKDLAFMPLTKTKLVFIGPKDFDQDFDPARTPLVIPRTGLSRNRLDRWMKQQNIRPRISTEVSGNEGLLAMVRLGCGIGIVPELVLERSPFRYEVKIIRQTPKLKPYVVGLCTTPANLKRNNIHALWHLAEQHQLQEPSRSRRTGAK
ncbi:HTH-type transcriptional activator IlvY [Verrucomicrobiaceae bacterium N1E253]|uniref:HTH-type transcriptional activator IlvY n=1 Tax=Oceaniferula marina TaxID=2748318 RepID=A0A851GNW5_9BACT|nr:HTH-type transcriptional activator IlvY [Oceaniferula marina]NWK56520.1 HTH-type transcriptional activator IlvY [Oceaniferula marina]